MFGEQVKVKGFALAHGAAVIERVELSCDDGYTWHTASIVSTPQQWAWCFWEINCPVKPGEHHLVVRAFDNAGNAQAQHLREVWNFKDYLNNAYHRIKIRVVDG